MSPWGPTLGSVLMELLALTVGISFFLLVVTRLVALTATRLFEVVGW
ncbi:MAG: hypothetical protein HYV02_04485 [Deltaproteobacteria bacterium]|nr:hypothetical protein [Deltaproteobacteria bacterium]